jgi:hypothetical protein
VPIEASRTAGGRRFALHPFELYIVAATLVAFLFLRAHGLDFGWNTARYTFANLPRTLAGYLALGVALQLLAHALRRRSPRDYLRGLLRDRWSLHWLRLWIAASLLYYGYVWLKVSVPLVRGALYDTELWRLDRFLHFGVSPTVLAIELFAGTPLARFLDEWYALWLATVPIAFAYVFASARRDAARNFVFANCLLWTLGAWGYVAFPAAGPCYASPDVLEPVRADIPKAIASQAILWEHYLGMIRAREKGLTAFSPLLGVAALPSLHVGAHVLFALWARRYEPRLYLPAAVAAGLTFVGSLVTGWHYALDGYAGAALAWLAVRVADRCEPVAPAEGEPAPSTRPAPGAAKGARA